MARLEDLTVGTRVSGVSSVGSPRRSSTRHASERDAGKINEETRQHLATLPGAEVDVKLIRVPRGIDDRRIRIVSENATALKLVASNFERE